MRVSVGRQSATRDALNIASGDGGPSEDPKGAKLMDTQTMRVTDARHSVFIELRERGADGVIAWNDVFTHEPRRRGRPARASRTPWAVAPATRAINVWSDVVQSTHVELFFARGGLNIKPCKLRNVATPYFVIAGRPTASHEPVFVMDGYAVVTTLERRQAFTQQVYDLATQTQNPMYLMAALDVLRILFFSRAQSGAIPMTHAEKVYEKYTRTAERIFRGQTPHEQLTAFTLAFRMLAKNVGVATAAVPS